MDKSRLAAERARDDYRMRSLKYLAREHSPTVQEERIANRFPWMTPRVPLLDFIVDFLDQERMMVLEVDGIYHFRQWIKDWKRDRRLYEELGLCTLRVLNVEVMDDFEATAKRIEDWVPEPPSQDPPYRPLVTNTTLTPGARTQKLTELVRRWASRPRAEVVADHEFLRWLIQLNFSDQELVVERSLWERIIHWPEEGYKKGK